MAVTPFIWCRELGIEVAPHVVLALRGVSSVCGTLLVPQSVGIALGIVRIASIGCALVPGDLLG
jgi:hypothetical protein